MFCLLFVLVRLSVPVQVFDWKDSFPKCPIMWWDVKPYSINQSLRLFQEQAHDTDTDRQTDRF